MRAPNLENGLRPKRRILLNGYRLPTTLAYKSNLLPTFDSIFPFLFLSLNELLMNLIFKKLDSFKWWTSWFTLNHQRIVRWRLLDHLGCPLSLSWSWQSLRPTNSTWKSRSWCCLDSHSSAASFFIPRQKLRESKPALIFLPSQALLFHWRVAKRRPGSQNLVRTCSRGNAAKCPQLSP
jgi:hypothetical protein